MMTVIRSYHQSHIEHDDSDEIIMMVIWSMMTLIRSSKSYGHMEYYDSDKIIIEYYDNDKIIIKVIWSMMTVIRSSSKSIFKAISCDWHQSKNERDPNK